MKTKRQQKIILWADDDADDLSMIEEVLKDIDHPVRLIEVNNGNEVIGHLQSVNDPGQFPCLIVLDLNMPGMDGKEALQYLKTHKTYQSIPLVVFTTSEDEMDRDFCTSYKVPLFTKPETYAMLKTTMNKILGFCKGSKAA